MLFMLLLSLSLLLLLLLFMLLLLLWEIRSFMWLVEMSWLLILICIMKMTTCGPNGWKLCSERASLKHTSCTVVAPNMNAIYTTWIAWTVLSALSVSKTTKTTLLFRYHFLSLNLKFFFLLPGLFVLKKEEKRNRLSWMHILYCSFSVSPYAPSVNNCIRTD